jgi:diguanylate cyclase (GGDEF)-like protein
MALNTRPVLEAGGRVPYLQVLTGVNAGQMFHLTGLETVIGRDDKTCQIVLEDKGVSRNHCRLVRSGEEITIIDMGSTNGTLVGDETVSRQVLLEGQQVSIGAAVLRFGTTDPKALEVTSRLFRGATRDGLTGVLNRAYLMDRLDHEMTDCLQNDWDLAFVLFDVDHFKKVNDTYGHPAGEEVLRRAGKILRETARRQDILGRYGGEEFCIVMPQQDLEGGLRAANRVREAFEKATMEVPVTEGKASISVTISGGVSTLIQYKDAEALVKAADEALYRAKQGGRNRIEGAPVDPKPETPPEE